MLIRVDTVSVDCVSVSELVLSFINEPVKKILFDGRKPHSFVMAVKTARCKHYMTGNTASMLILSACQ